MVTAVSRTMPLSSDRTSKDQLTLSKYLSLPSQQAIIINCVKLTSYPKILSPRLKIFFNALWVTFTEIMAYPLSNVMETSLREFEA